jgi:hypothetical protein
LFELFCKSPPPIHHEITFNITFLLCIISLVMPVTVDARAHSFLGLHKRSATTKRSIEERQEVSDFCGYAGIASCLEISRDEAFRSTRRPTIFYSSAAPWFAD